MTRPVPLSILLLLLLGLCGLCGWQWKREDDFRDLTRRQQAEITSTRKELEESTTRAKAADAEILRLTGSLTELRAGSVAKTQHDELLEAAQKMKESIQKQNAVLKEQQDALTKANTSIASANDTIRSLAAERDAVAKKLNVLTVEFNKLANPDRSSEPQKTVDPKP